MGVIYPNRSRQARRPKPVKKRKSFRRFMLLAIGFTLVNLAVANIYHERTYPRTTVAGFNIGNTAYDAVEQRAAALSTLPKTMTITYQGKKVSAPLKDLGVSIDGKRTRQSIDNRQHWLPIISLFSTHQLAEPTTVNELTLQKYGEQARPTFHQAPINATLTASNGSLTVNQGKDGYDLSIAKLKEALLNGLDAHKTTITAPVTFKAPAYTAAQAQRDAHDFQAASKTSVTFKAGKMRLKAKPADIITWYASKGNSYSLDDDAIRSYILAASIKAGVRPANLHEAATKAKQAVENRKAVTITLTPFTTTLTYHYCVDGKGVDRAAVKKLSETVKQAFNDPRGWSLEGQVIFKETDSASNPCDFTVWLARAELMPDFGDVCDTTWSCRAGSNVIINYSRWQEASASWEQYGGSLSDYRTMAINHETGHWFGFEHSACPGSGQVAPVMMQQSIELDGCSFNPWPTAKELSIYRSVIGL